MKRKQPIQLEPVYRIIYGICLSLGMLLIADTFLKQEWSVVLLILWTVLFHGILYGAIEKKMLFPVCGIFLALEAIIVFLAYRSGVTLEKAMPILTVELVCLAAALIAYCLVRHFRLRVLVTAASIGIFIYFALYKIAIPVLGVCCVLFSALFILVEVQNRKAAEHTKAGILYLTPLFVLSLVLISTLPVEDEPIKWVTVKKIYRYVNERVTGLVASVENVLKDGPHTYDMPEFDEDKIQRQKKPQLTVNGKRTYSPLYLTGNVYATYNGKTWEEAPAVLPYEEADYHKQAREMSSWLDGGVITSEERGEMSEDHTLSIIYTGINTSSLFMPLNGENISLLRGGELDDNTSNVRLEEPEGHGFTYMLTYTELDYANPIFQRVIHDMMEQERPTDERTEFIFETYTQLPETLPQEVKDLAEEVTVDCTNDYDKMKALEEHMKNYTYARGAGKTPEDQDYVAYFLFERKEGYCTRYASSLAVLGRCLGIPTRYVEGFATARSSYYNLFSLNLTSMDSHAWVEAYFPGVGWIPFDGVPGYRERLNVTWEERPELDAQLESKWDSITELNMDELMRSQRYMSKQDKIMLAVQTMLLVLAIFVLIVGLFFLRKQIQRARYRRLSDLDKMKYLMQKMLAIGALYQLPILSGETLQEYDVRTDHKLDTSYSVFSEVCMRYEKARFGNGSISVRDVKEMESCLRYLEKKYREDRKKRQR